MKYSAGEKFGVSVLIVLVCLLCAAIFGYGSNIYKLTQCDFASPYKCEAIHGIGIFPIVGIFTGYMSFEGE